MQPQRALNSDLPVAKSCVWENLRLGCFFEIEEGTAKREERNTTGFGSSCFCAARLQMLLADSTDVAPSIGTFIAAYFLIAFGRLMGNVDDHARHGLNPSKN
jgi:hypothetical protein